MALFTLTSFHPTPIQSPHLNSQLPTPTTPATPKPPDTHAHAHPLPSVPECDVTWTSQWTIPWMATLPHLTPPLAEWMHQNLPASTFTTGYLNCTHHLHLLPQPLRHLDPLLPISTPSIAHHLHSFNLDHPTEPLLPNQFHWSHWAEPVSPNSFHASHWADLIQPNPSSPTPLVHPFHWAQPITPNSSSPICQAHPISPNLSSPSHLATIESNLLSPSYLATILLLLSPTCWAELIWPIPSRHHQAQLVEPIPSSPTHQAQPVEPILSHHHLAAIEPNSSSQTHLANPISPPSHPTSQAQPSHLTHFTQFVLLNSTHFSSCIHNIYIYFYWIQVQTQTQTYWTRFKRFGIQVHQSSGLNLVVKVWVWLKRAQTQTKPDRGQSNRTLTPTWQITQDPFNGRAIQTQVSLLANSCESSTTKLMNGDTWQTGKKYNA